MGPSESFHEYPANVDGIFFDTWDEIFGDIDKYFATWS